MITEPHIANFYDRQLQDKLRQGRHHTNYRYLSAEDYLVEMKERLEYEHRMMLEALDRRLALIGTMADETVKFGEIHTMLELDDAEELRKQGLAEVMARINQPKRGKRPA